MERISGAFFLGLLTVTSTAKAGNSEDIDPERRAEQGRFFRHTGDPEGAHRRSLATTGVAIGAGFFLFAWKKSEKFLLGGGLDLVIATRRLTQIVSGAYADGQGGTLHQDFNQNISGGGLQLKGGLQWAPIEEVQIGWMAATPRYLVYTDNETTATQSSSPPAFQTPSAQVNPVGITVNEMGVNLAVKAGF